MHPVIHAWRDRILAHERDASALRGGSGGHGHAHGGHDHHTPGGHGGFTYSNRPLDPRRTDDPVLNALCAALPPNAAVLDVGGGAGRYALPLAARARRVTVVEPSADSCETLRSRAAEAGIANIDVIAEPWEDAETPAADLVLCSLVLHHVPDAEPFVAKLQAHAAGSVVIVEMMETPGALEIPFYRRVHGTAPTPLPGLPQVLDLLWAMDIYPDVSMLPPETRRPRHRPRRRHRPAPPPPRRRRRTPRPTSASAPPPTSCWWRPPRASSCAASAPAAPPSSPGSRPANGA